MAAAVLFIYSNICLSINRQRNVNNNNNRSIHSTVEAIGIRERQTLLSCFYSSGDRMMGLDVLLVMALLLLVVSDHDFFRICIVVLLKNPDIYYLEKNLRSNLAWG